MNFFQLFMIGILTQFTLACTMPIVNSQPPADLPVSLLANTQMSIQSLNGTQTERGLLFTFNTVLFEFDRSNLTAEGHSRMNELARVVEGYPQRKVYIEGHTDSIGQAAYNMALSENRALSVRQALTAKGIHAERLIVRAYGETRPVATNATSGGRQQNRRVEVLISNETLGIKSMQSLKGGCVQRVKPCAPRGGCAI